MRPTVGVPLGNLRIRGHDLDRVTLEGHGQRPALAHGRLELVAQEVAKLDHELITEGLGEGPHVRDEGRGQQHVAGEQVLVGGELLDVDAPALVLRRQRAGQPLRQVELLLPACHAVQGVLLLDRGRVELLVELVELGLQLGDRGEHRGQSRVGAAQLLVRLAQRLTLGLDRDDNVVVVHDVDHERAQAGGGRVLGHNNFGLEVLQCKVLADLLPVERRHGVVVHLLLDLFFQDDHDIIPLAPEELLVSARQLSTCTILRLGG